MTFHSQEVVAVAEEEEVDAVASVVAEAEEADVVASVIEVAEEEEADAVASVEDVVVMVARVAEVLNSREPGKNCEQ